MSLLGSRKRVTLIGRSPFGTNDYYRAVAKLTAPHESTVVIHETLASPPSKKGITARYQRDHALRQDFRSLGDLVVRTADLMLSSDSDRIKAGIPVPVPDVVARPLSTRKRLSMRLRNAVLKRWIGLLHLEGQIIVKFPNRCRGLVVRWLQKQPDTRKKRVRRKTDQANQGHNQNLLTTAEELLARGDNVVLVVDVQRLQSLIVRLCNQGYVFRPEDQQWLDVASIADLKAKM